MSRLQYGILIGSQKSKVVFESVAALQYMIDVQSIRYSIRFHQMEFTFFRFITNMRVMYANSRAFSLAFHFVESIQVFFFIQSQTDRKVDWICKHYT